MVDFNGRVGRGFFVLYFLIFEVLLWALALLQVFGNIQSKFLYALIVLAGFIVQYPQVAAGVRRCHDLGKSGMLVWWSVLFIPKYILFFYLAFKKGQDQPNQYGDRATPGLFAPKKTDTETTRPTVKRLEAASATSLANSTSPSGSIAGGTGATNKASHAGGDNDVVARLSQLKDLYDKGLITSTVYSEAQKEALKLSGAL